MKVQFSKIALVAGISLALAFTLSCSDDTSNGDGGGKGNNMANYRTGRIDNQVWMLENLNYNVSGSRCYEDKESNCDKYGRLYDWATAKTVCPSGWHLPSDAEWTELTDFVGSDAGTKLKAASGWNGGGNGTDEYKFLALPGGTFNSNGSFFGVGIGGYWWSATESDASNAYGRVMIYLDTEVSRNDYDKAVLFSVRCIKD